MNIFFDTEFIEDGKTIDLVSIGLVREDGKELYCISEACDAAKASEWVRNHVLSELETDRARHSRRAIAQAVRDFCGEAPEFWAYYGDYDWVALCQLFGSMMDLPKGWPAFAYDLRQWLNHKGLWTVRQPDASPHHALLDARWIMDTWRHHQ